MQTLTETENIINLFLAAARQVPSRPAIIQGSDEISFSNLARQVRRQASWYSAKGISKGDRVMVLATMGPDLYCTVLSLFYIGATVVLMDSWSGMARLTDCCRQANCKALIGPKLLTWIAPLYSDLRRIPLKINVGYRELRNKMEPATTSASDVALITFTTGTTGKPKGALRTHGFLMKQYEAMQQSLEFSGEEIDMPLMPVVLLMNLACGATSVISRLPAKAKKFEGGRLVSLVLRKDITRVEGSPAAIRAMTDYSLDRLGYTVGLMKITVGGAATFPNDAQRFRDAFPHADIRIVYGSTEAEPICVLPAADLARVDGSNGLLAGKPHPWVRMKLLRPNTSPLDPMSESALEQHCVPDGQIGEVIVSGPHILTGYLNNEDAFRQNKIMTGDTIWHRTGDTGYVDEDGNLFLLGRMQHIIRQPGKEPIYPFIAEAFCRTLDGISDGAILEVNGRLTAVLEARKPSVQAENELKQRFSGIDKIIYRKTLPRDPRHRSRIDYDTLGKMVK